MASPEAPEAPSKVVPAAAVFSDDNRMPDLEGHARNLARQVLRLGWKRLREGPAPGARQLSQRAPTGLRIWAPIFGSLLLIGVGALVLGGWLGGFVGLLALAGAFAALWTGAALDRLVPPPRRPDCQAEHLPLQPGVPHALTPFHRETGIVEYVPGQIWLSQMPLVFYGVQMGTRMAVLRANGANVDRDLLVYSPMPLDEARRASVESLGRVRYLLAPNLIHHLWVNQWLEAFPDAEAWAAPNLAPRRPDVAWAGVIEDERTQVPWDRAVADFRVLKGHAFHEEVVLFHAPSRTLLTCDALENLGHAGDLASLLPSRLSRWATAATFELMGMRERPTPPTDWKLTVRDLEALHRSASAVLRWDFERIVVAHGRLVERDARAVWSDGFAFAR